jgi:hypothetical protein
MGNETEDQLATVQEADSLKEQEVAGNDSEPDCEAIEID